MAAEKSVVQYLVGTLMIAFAVYQAYILEYWEMALYASAGMAFIVMGIIKNRVFGDRYKKLLTVLSWIFIIIAGFLLLFLARTDF